MAYFKCTEKGSNLTLNQAIEIAQNKEATSSQLSYIWKEFGSNTGQAAINKPCEMVEGAKPKHKSQQQQQ